MSEERNNHDLDEAGKTLGKLYNVSSYDKEYGGKKGMKFFGWAVVVVFFVSLLLLNIKTHDDIELVYADDEGITVYELNIGFLGTYGIKAEHHIDYPPDTTVYRNIAGKPAEVARTVSEYEAEAVVGTEWILEALPETGLISSFKKFITPEEHSRMLIHEYDHDFPDLYYGMPINKGFRKIDFRNMEYIVFTGFAAKLQERTTIKLINDMTTLQSAE